MTTVVDPPRPAPDRPAVRWWASRPAWIVLGLVAVGALAVGSVHPAVSSAAARRAALDAVIKCPACEDLSIAQSDAPSAVSLRREVATFVADGWSNGRIESWVTARFGPSALLVPQSSGVSGVLFFVPVALIAIAAVLLGRYLWRRRSTAADRSGP